MFSRGVRVRLDCGDQSVLCNKSRTHQSFAKDADINNIMSRFKKTGFLIDPLKVNPYRRPNFGDFSDIGDLASQITRIREAEAAFMVLPASIRERFHNDVGELLEFVQNDANRAEAVEIGLLPKDVLNPVPKDYTVTPPSPQGEGGTPPPAAA